MFYQVFILEAAFCDESHFGFNKQLPSNRGAEHDAKSHSIVKMGHITNSWEGR